MINQRAVISFSSETEARRAVRALQAEKLPARVVRLPRDVSRMGCSFGAEPPVRVLQEALRILRSAGWRGRTLRVFLSRDGEHFAPADGGERP